MNFDCGGTWQLCKFHAPSPFSVAHKLLVQFSKTFKCMMLESDYKLCHTIALHLNVTFHLSCTICNQIFFMDYVFEVKEGNTYSTIGPPLSKQLNHKSVKSTYCS